MQMKHTRFLILGDPHKLCTLESSSDSARNDAGPSLCEPSRLLADFEPAPSPCHVRTATESNGGGGQAQPQASSLHTTALFLLWNPAGGFRLVVSCVHLRTSLRIMWGGGRDALHRSRSDLTLSRRLLSCYKYALFAFHFIKALYV